MTNAERLFDLLGELARRRRLIGERYFAQFGLNHTEARLLNLLNREGGQATQDVLSDRIVLDRSNAGRALKALEARGLIERQAAPDDRRTRAVRITEAGNRLSEEIAKGRSDLAHQFFVRLNEEDAALILELLAPSAEVGAAR